MYDAGELETEDLIAEEDVVITISHQSYIKRQALTNFRNQNRGAGASRPAAARLSRKTTR